MATSIARTEAYNFAPNNTLESIEFLCNFWREQGAEPIDERDNTLLHFLAIYGNVDAFTKLIRHGLVNSDQLKKQNDKGNTALHEAARFGQKDVAEIMLRNERDLVSLRNNLGETPLYIAAAYGKREVFTLLENFNSDYMMSRHDGCTVLHALVLGRYYYLALTTLESYPDLAHKHNENGVTALHLLAKTPSSFRSGSSYVLRNLGTRPFLPLHILEVIVYFSANLISHEASGIPAIYVESEVSSDVENQNEKRVVISSSKRSFLVGTLLGFPWIKGVDAEKQKHILALALTRRLMEFDTFWSHLRRSSEEYSVQKPLFQAVKHDISEVAMEILKKYPNAANYVDEKGRNIMHVAVEHKCTDLYEQLDRTIVHKDSLMADVDYEGNTVLHLAANEGLVPNFPLGVLSQMKWDVYWFKRVKRDSHTHLLDLHNSCGKTADELFVENHSHIREVAEKTSKDFNQGVMVVSALITTVSFAALFTLPGGFDQNNGHPILLNNHKRDLRTFIFYVAGTLFSSLFSLGTLLLIQLSPFHIENFYFALPMQYILVAFSLLCSLFFSLALCLQTFILEDVMQTGYIAMMFIAILAMVGTFADAMCIPARHTIHLLLLILTSKHHEM